MNIYISTMAFIGQSPAEMTALAATENFAVEFSSALPYDPAMETIFREYPHPKMVHNYFPAPQYPFVLNLASTNAVVRLQSIEHCLQGLRWTKMANAPFYCAHAGFCLDPRPEDLGKQLQQSAEPIDRSVHWQLFLESVDLILKMADTLEVDFYIENNVCAAMNINAHGQNPLLCSDPQEMIRLVAEIGHDRLGLLLDTAHLKVSANTLGFDHEEAVLILQPFIRAIHHSDNEGVLDNNQPLTEDYWFNQFMPLFGNIPHVLEVKKQRIADINTQLGILREAALGN